MRIRKAEQAAFAQILRTTREEAALTQKEVALRLGVPQSFVSKYESGERRLDVLELRLVCAALNSSLASLLLKLEETPRGTK